MSARIKFIGMLVPLFGVVLMVLAACGGSESSTPMVPVNGPALLFFYTDN